MDEIDKLIQRRLPEARPGSEPVAPAEEDYLAFAEGRLSGAKLDTFLEYLAAYPEARERAAAVKRALLSLDEAGSGLEAPRTAVQKVKRLREEGRAPRLDCPHCKKPIPLRSPLGRQKLRNAIWLTLAALSFGTSFFMPKYFLQCLAVALLFGFKWVVDSKNTRTQILVYKQLSEVARGEEDGIISGGKR